MNLFGKILDEITLSLKKKSFLKEDIAMIISKELGLIIDTDGINIKDGKLYINCSPTLKTSILFKKEKLLKSLSKYNIKSIG